MKKKSQRRKKRSSTTSDENKLSTQIIGNIGLFHVCYELSRRGFNVVPTSRNTRAVDLIVGTADFKRHATVQIKTTTIDMGITLQTKKKAPTINDALAFVGMADIWVYVRLDPDHGHKVKRVTIWESSDKDLLREGGTHWWYQPWDYPRTAPDKLKLQWANQTDDGGWKVIENFLRRKKS